MPPEWEYRDIRDVVPAEAVAELIAFCDKVLVTSSARVAIARDAIALLNKHEEAFAKNGVDLRFFGYWLEYQYDQLLLPGVIEALMEPKPPKQKTLKDILPEACLVKLQNFADDYARKRLIIEPGKATVTLLRERVLEPFREQILAPETGIADLDYLAMLLCTQLEIDPN